MYPAALTKRLPPAPPPGGAGASKENLAGKVNVWKTTPAPKTKVSGVDLTCAPTSPRWRTRMSNP